MQSFVPYYAMKRPEGTKILVTAVNRLECANSVKFIRLDEPVTAADLKIAEKAAKDSPQRALTGRARRQERMNRARELSQKGNKEPANLRPPTHAGEVVDITEPAGETVVEPVAEPEVQAVAEKPPVSTAEQKAAQAEARKAARKRKADAKKESLAREKAAAAEAAQKDE